MDLAHQAAGIGALADATRRALYEYVAGQPEPVGREQAATALGIALHNVNFHLDRLVAEGLRCDSVRACLEPGVGRCCVTVRNQPPTGTERTAGSERGGPASSGLGR